MRECLLVFSLPLVVAAACSGDPPKTTPSDTAVQIDAPAIDAPVAKTMFSFFITSTGGPAGGDFRATVADPDGLAGADELCRQKAVAANAMAATRTWRAYLSTTAINARDRIGAGPWFNKNLVMVASSVTNLHDAAGNALNGTNSIDENGAEIANNVHDILTGSDAQGMATATTCANWTSSADNAMATVGHHNRMGGGTDPTSWNAAHLTQGCSATAFQNTGGRGSIYCFAADPL